MSARSLSILELESFRNVDYFTYSQVRIKFSVESGHTLILDLLSQKLAFHAIMKIVQNLQKCFRISVKIINSI